MNDIVETIISAATDVERFRSDPVPRELIDRIVAAATTWRPPRFSSPPWRVMVVVGEERERLIARWRRRTSR